MYAIGNLFPNSQQLYEMARNILKSLTIDEGRTDFQKLYVVNKRRLTELGRGGADFSKNQSWAHRSFKLSDRSKAMSDL